ncbi:cation:proton antiporter, partial [PVC group bacterium]|nr:cation:proton antiporter [PVC group bacterium]
MLRNLFHQKKLFTLCLMFLGLMGCAVAFGAGASDTHDALHMDEMTNTFWMLAVILLVAKLSSLIEKIGQPAVLGELMMGVILGNLVFFGIDIFETIKNNQFVLFLAEMGVVVLLFQVGLESTLKEMMGVGVKAFWVAIVGIVTPFTLGAFFVGPLLMPGLSTHAYLFLGATLTATSVGITARVFKDLGHLHGPEAQIVLGAAVIDDILGLIILSVVSAMVTMGSVTAGTVSFIFFKAIVFLVGTLIFGSFLAKPLNDFLSKVHAGHGMKFTVLISFCLLFSFIAHKLGLAPIVGAFAAGLVLEPKHFQSFDDPKIVEDLKGSINEFREPHPLKEKV